MKNLAIVSFLMILSINTALAGLVVEYTFDGTGQDSSGNNEHLTLQNGASYGPGYSGQALQLDGVDDHAFVSIGDYGLTVFTFELWVNVPNFGKNIHYISLHQDRYIVLGDYYSGNGPINTWADGLNPIDVAPTASDPTGNEWHHLAFTYDGNNQVVYVDGVAIKTAPTTGALSGGYSGLLAIGSRYTQDNQFVEGLLDNVRIHDVALDVNQLGYFVDSDLSATPSVPVPSMTVWGLLLLTLLIVFTGIRRRFS